MNGSLLIVSRNPTTNPVFDFYHNLNHFYSALTEFCTIHNCPTMNAGPT